MGQKGAERRSSRRVIITAIAEIDSVPPRRTSQGYVTNISRGGLGVFAQTSFQKASEVTVRLTFFGSKGISETPPIRGVVTRDQSVGKVYSLGIKFLDLEKDADERLLSYLDQAERSLSR